MITSVCSTLKYYYYNVVVVYDSFIMKAMLAFARIPDAYAIIFIMHTCTVQQIG